MKKNYRRKNPATYIPSRRFKTRFTARSAGFAASASILGDQAFERHASAVQGAKKHLRHEQRRYDKRLVQQELQECE